jgi:hypothetical protein
MSRRALAGPAAAVVLALLLSLAGCGGDGTSGYCNDLESQSKKIADILDSDSSTALLDGLPVFRDLAKKAPEDLDDEWQTFLGALDGLDQALKDAGVKASDFKDGKPPAGLSASDQKSIVDAADQISTDDVVAASTGIEQEARDVCKVNLGL